MRVLLFGIAKDIAGKPVITVDGVNTVAELKSYLYKTYPRLEQLRSLMIAVNKTYAGDGQALQASDEVAVIPPVSGG